MVHRIKQLIQKHWDLVPYLFFGVLTTAVDFAVYFPCFNVLGLSATASTIIAWCISVLFAFLTNKPFVFQSHDWSPQILFPELVKFLGTRIGSGAFQSAIMWLTVDQLNWNGNIMKLIVAVFVVIINYIGSKLLVFHQK